MDNKGWKDQDRQYHEDAEIVASYDSRIVRRYALEHKYVTLDKWAGQLKKEGKGLVLDFGCGTGAATLKMLKNGIKTVSVDGSPAMLNELRRKAKKDGMDCLCVLGDVENLPFKDKVFDGLVCAGVLHHLPDIEKGAREQARVLKSGGLLFIAEPFKDKPWISYPYHFFIFALKFAIKFFKKQRVSTREGPLSSLSVGSILEVLERNGFGYNIEYLVYWPVVFGCLQESLGYPLFNLINRVNRGQARGDSVVITAFKK